MSGIVRSGADVFCATPKYVHTGPVRDPGVLHKLHFFFYSLIHNSETDAQTKVMNKNKKGFNLYITSGNWRGPTIYAQDLSPRHMSQFTYPRIHTGSRESWGPWQLFLLSCYLTGASGGIFVDADGVVYVHSTANACILNTMRLKKRLSRKNSKC